MRRHRHITLESDRKLIAAAIFAIAGLSLLVWVIIMDEMHPANGLTGANNRPLSVQVAVRYYGAYAMAKL